MGLKQKKFNKMMMKQKQLNKMLLKQKQLNMMMMKQKQLTNMHFICEKLLRFRKVFFLTRTTKFELGPQLF